MWVSIAAPIILSRESCRKAVAASSEASSGACVRVLFSLIDGCLSAHACAHGLNNSTIPRPSIHPSIRPCSGRNNSAGQQPQPASYQQAASGEGEEEERSELHPMATDATQTEEGAYLTWEERFGGLVSTRQSRVILVGALVFDLVVAWPALSGGRPQSETFDGATTRVFSFVQSR